MMASQSTQQVNRTEIKLRSDKTVADSVGDGPVCIFVHGLGEGRYYWRHIITDPRLMGRNIAYDLAGHGDASRQPEGKYPIKEFAESLLELLEEFSGYPIVLVGHSMGGEIALRAAATGTHNVRGVILVDCGLERKATVADKLQEELASTDQGFASVEQFSGWLAANRPLVSKELRAFVADQALQPHPHFGYQLKRDPAVLKYRFEESVAEEANWDALARVACPILILRGEASSYLSPETAGRMTRRAQNATLESVPRAGHGIPLDNPTGFLSAILPFLSVNLWNSVDAMRVRE